MVSTVVVDTSALLAMAFNSLGEEARRVLKAIRRELELRIAEEKLYRYIYALRRGRVEGLITSLVVYEFTLHWHRGRIPSLESVEEVLSFLTTYFKIVDLNYRDMAAIATIKAEGDEILRRAPDPALRERSISATDASLIYIAKKLGIPVITGSKSLKYVANTMGIEVLW